MCSEAIAGLITSVCPCIDRKAARAGNSVVLLADETELVLLQYDPDFSEWLIVGHPIDESESEDALKFGEFNYSPEGIEGYAQARNVNDLYYWVSMYRHAGRTTWKPGDCAGDCRVFERAINHSFE